MYILVVDNVEKKNIVILHENNSHGNFSIFTCLVEDDCRHLAYLETLMAVLFSTVNFAVKTRPVSRLHTDLAN